MNLKKAIMTQEEQRVAIAKACGWLNRTGMWHNPDGTPIGFTPDYLKDLNAMHEAILGLQEEDQCEFCLRLTEIVRKGKLIGNGLRTWDEINATAAQRAEAFLRTLGLWKD
jgi:hypothetical protein